MDGGQEIDDKRKDVECKDKCDDPFEDGGDVLVVAPVCRDEDDGENELNDDEGEFHPEGDAEDAVLAVVCLRVLEIVLGAFLYSCTYIGLAVGIPSK